MIIDLTKNINEQVTATNWVKICKWELPPAPLGHGANALKKYWNSREYRCKGCYEAKTKECNQAIIDYINQYIKDNPNTTTLELSTYQIETIVLLAWQKADNKDEKIAAIKHWTLMIGLCTAASILFLTGALGWTLLSIGLFGGILTIGGGVLK